MRSIAAPLLIMALAACGDADPTAPRAGPGADQPVATVVQSPLRDALERIAPTLGTGPAAASLRSRLVAAVEDPTTPRLDAVESALVALEAERPDAAVEADVIRLAVRAER